MPVNLGVWSGNRVDVFCATFRVGLCQSARLSDDYSLEDASGIGDIHVIEHVPTKATHIVAVTQMCLFVGNLRDRGTTAGFAINGDEMLIGNVFDITVSNAQGTTTPAQVGRSYLGCSYNNGDVDVSAHRILISSGTFKALDVVGGGI